MWKRILVILILFCLGGLTLFLVLGREEPSEIKASGILEALEVDVRSKIAGEITKIGINEGDLVSKNQILGHIDVPEVKAQKKGAYAKYSLALAEWDRMKRLYAQGIITKSGFDRAESLFREAEMEKALIDARVTDTAITAPISGTVVAKVAEEGEVIDAGSTILTVADLRTIILKVYVAEKEVGRIRLKGTANISIDSYPHETFKGAVTFISSKAEFTPKYVQAKEELMTQVFEVKIVLPNPEGKLKPGLSADAAIKID